MNYFLYNYSNISIIIIRKTNTKAIVFMDEITSDDFNDEQFKYSESNWLEFKESIVSCSIEKIIETICAFLNTDGGYIIIGINDNGKLVGHKSKSKNIDNFKLLIDNKISNNTIIYQNDEVIIDKYLSIIEIVNKNKNKFILIKIFPQKDKNYKLINGTVIHRLNASNRKIKTTKLMTELHFASNLKQIEITIIDKYNKIIRQLNSEITELKKRDTEQKNNITLLNNLINDTNKAFTKLYNICYPSPTQFTMR